MQAKLLGAVLIIFIIVLALAVSLVKAQTSDESFSVFTDQTTYNVGDTVTVLTQANYIDPNSTITVTDVNVTDPSGNLVAQWNNLNVVLSNTTTVVQIGTLTANTPGNYTVNAAATGCLTILFCHWIFQIKPFIKPVPEYPLGTITALTAVLAVAGLYIKVKRKQK